MKKQNNVSQEAKLLYIIAKMRHGSNDGPRRQRSRRQNSSPI